jgi:hypothetical protein
MRSQNVLKKPSIIPVGIKKRYFHLFLIICCLGLCPTFGLLADQNQANNLISPSLATPDHSPSRTKIYFYNPEINTARNLVLKNTWDSYLYEMGHYEFQPVDDGKDFEKLVRQEKDAAFIMAEWLYHSLFSSASLENQDIELAFRGIKNGNDTYRKILVANKSTLDFEKVTIACSGSKARAQEVLKSIYPELSTQQLENLNVLLVPKDIDALMAVGYGLAEMALTTQVSLSKMALINEHIYKDMIVLKESKPFRRSVLVFKSSNKALKQNLAQALINMTMHPAGQEAMSLLGLDAWKTVDGLSAFNTESLLNNKNENGGQNNDN